MYRMFCGRGDRGYFGAESDRVIDPPDKSTEQPVRTLDDQVADRGARTRGLCIHDTTAEAPPGFAGGHPSTRLLTELGRQFPRTDASTSIQLEVQEFGRPLEDQ